MRVSRFRPLLLAFVTLALAGCSAPPAVSDVQSGLRQIGSVIQSHLPGSASTNSSSDGAAIQLVILRGDFEQEQAITRRDSSVMQDTSTQSYYQQAAQQNQALLAAGVTAIKLVGIEWGAVRVNGMTATASPIHR